MHSQKYKKNEIFKWKEKRDKSGFLKIKNLSLFRIKDTSKKMTYFCWGMQFDFLCGYYTEDIPFPVFPSPQIVPMQSLPHFHTLSLLLSFYSWVTDSLCKDPGWIFHPCDLSRLCYCYSAPLVVQTAECLPAMQATWLRLLVQEDSMEKTMATTSVFLPGESRRQRGLVG